MGKYGDIFDLQFFADGGGGAGAGAAGGGDGAAAGQAGGMAPDAAEQVVPGRRPRKENPLKDVQYGIQPQQQAQQQPQQTEESFDDLIKGKYKKEYGERVQSVIRERFRANAEQEAKMQKLQPVLEMLGQKYDVDPTDIDRLAAVVSDDDSLYEDEALERGMSVESLKAIKAMERENTRLKALEQRTLEEQRNRAHFNKIAQQADQVKQIYPDFDLQTELQNPQFLRLTSPQVDVDVRTAYEIIHKDQLMGAGMQYAVQRTAQQMSNAIRSNGTRPRENGLSGRTGGKPVKTDPRTLSKEDRAEIRRRVAAGEKIVF